MSASRASREVHKSRLCSSVMANLPLVGSNQRKLPCTRFVTPKLTRTHSLARHQTSPTSSSINNAATTPQYNNTSPNHRAPTLYRTPRATPHACQKCHGVSCASRIVACLAKGYSSRKDCVRW